MHKLLIAAAATAIALPAAAHAAAPITGQWLTRDDKAVVMIAPCGKGVCGKIVKILKPAPGSDGRDRRNSNAALRDRPLVGLPLLADMVDAGGDWRGRIYNPEDGREYRSIVKRNADGTLGVQGCWGIFCKTQTWKPAR